MSIEEKIKELGPWYQNIELSCGKFTVKEEMPPARGINWQTLLDAMPQDLSDLSVLDIGCNAGAFSIEAKKRNASRVVGIDYSDHFINQAIFCANNLELDIEYQKSSVEDYLKDCDAFDITLLIGVFYHLRSPHSIAKMLYEKTNKMCIVETRATTVEFLESEFGIIQNPRPKITHSGSTWINYKAVNDIFIDYAGFSSVEYIFKGGRMGFLLKK